MVKPEDKIVLFDAECVLCSANAKFILTRDKRKIFWLASMQSEIGAGLFAENGLDPADPSSILVIEGERVRKDSNAVLSICESLPFPWSMARIFRLVPAFLRDSVYLFIARNRYRIFGKRETCWIAPSHLQSRIL